MKDSHRRLKAAKGPSLCLRDLFLLLFAFVAARSEAADGYTYQQVIITFDTSQDCTRDMFPSLWWTIIEEGLAEIGIHPTIWTHGFESHEGGRHMQSNAGCPDWCRYLTQYCECLCVSNCDGKQGADQGEDANADDDENANDNDDDNTDGNTGGNTSGNGGRPSGGRPSGRRLRGASRIDARRRIQAAQFVVDEEAVKSHIEGQLQSSSLEIACMRQQDGIRVYVITAND
jgi:hypothetical protein